MAADISFIRKEGCAYSDIQIEDNDVLRDNTLATAVTISLLTDRRATLAEITAANYSITFPYDLRGWWGDTYRDTPIGSKLWLNKRRKSTSSALNDHTQYVREALAYLIDSNIAKDIKVYAEWTSLGVMAMSIRIIHPDDSKSSIAYSYTFIWEEVSNGLH